MSEIVNRVASSGLITIEAENYQPKTELLTIDIADYLWQGLALKEKDFRTAISEHNWEQYQGKAVAVFCSADAIVPLWASMLIAVQLTPHTQEVYFTSKKEANAIMWQKSIEKHLRPSEFIGAKVVIKGCSNKAVPESIYAVITSVLQPVVKSIMFGEPCSTVPVYKKKKS